MHCNVTYNLLIHKRAAFQQEASTPQEVLGADRKLMEHVKMLLEAGSCLKCQDPSGGTVLHEAVREKDISIVSILLHLQEGKALVDHKDRQGVTPRSLADENIARLFPKIVTPEEPDRWAEYRKMWPEEKKREPKIKLAPMPKKELPPDDKLFLLKKLRERIDNDSKKDLLAYFKTDEVIEFCDFKDENGETFLHWLVRKGDIDLFKPVSFMRGNCSMAELIKIAIEEGNAPFLEYFLNEHMMSLYGTDDDDRPYVFHMLEHKQKEMIRWFQRQHSYDYYKVDCQGNTALHIAAKSVEMYKLIRETFPKKNYEFYGITRNLEGELPWDIAIKADNVKIVKYEFEKVAEGGDCGNYQVFKRSRKEAISLAEKHNAKKVLAYLNDP